MKKIWTYLSTFAVTALTALSSAPLARAVENITPITINMETGSVDPVALVTTVGGWMLMLAGALVVVYLIYGGIIYITGGAKAEESAKKIIMNALIGLIVITLAYALANFALTLVQSAITS